MRGNAIEHFSLNGSVHYIFYKIVIVKKLQHLCNEKKKVNYLTPKRRIYKEYLHELFRTTLLVLSEKLHSRQSVTVNVVSET